MDIKKSKRNVRKFTVQVTIEMGPEAILADAIRQVRHVMHTCGHTDAVVTPTDRNST